MKNIPQAGNQNQYLKVEYDLSSADLKGMSAAPIQMVAAVPGKIIVFDSLEFVMTRTATAYANGGVVNVQYADTATGGGTTVHADIAATVLTAASAAVTYTHRISKDLSALADTVVPGVGLYLSNKTAAFITGTGTAKISIVYHII